MPGMSPPTWSCQPPPAGQRAVSHCWDPHLVGHLLPQALPVVSLCSRCSTAWIRDSVLAAFPAALYRDAITAPARMLLVPAGGTGKVRAARHCCVPEGWGAARAMPHPGASSRRHSQAPVRDYPAPSLQTYRGQTRGAAWTRCAPQSHPQNSPSAGPAKVSVRGTAQPGCR